VRRLSIRLRSVHGGTVREITGVSLANEFTTTSTSFSAVVGGQWMQTFEELEHAIEQADVPPEAKAVAKDEVAKARKSVKPEQVLRVAELVVRVASLIEKFP
jgi:hypothetical protein